MALLEVENLRTYFHTRHGIVRAVDGVSFAIESSEILGIVGESGSGKSVACYTLLGLIPMPPGRIESGVARFGGRDLLTCSASEMRRIRGNEIAMVFQDPMTALNPYFQVGRQVIEPLLVHEHCDRAEARERAAAMFREVGIADEEARLDAYPHEFSGGMRQRAMIAMALLTKPKLLIADEPTTALDVTVQAQILDSIGRMRRELGMAVLLITHNLGVVAEVCDRVLVMYAGRILESGATQAIFDNPKHPYTRALMASIPAAHAAKGALYTIPGMPPDLTAEIAGCPFAPRCEAADDRCRGKRPELVELEAGHASACLRVQAGEL